MKSRVVSMFCLAVAVTVLMASDASAQCPRRGGCSAVVDSVVQTYSPAETIVMSDVDKCVDGVCPSQPAAGGAYVESVLVTRGTCAGGGPVLVQGRPLANLGRRFLYRLRHPFAPIVRRY